MKVRNFILLSAFFVLTASAFFQCNSQTTTDLNAQEIDPEKTENAVLVETVKLEPRTMRSFILLSSTIETENTVDVYPQASGIVTDLYVEEGLYVKKNSVLIKLDDREQKIAEQKALVNFRKSQNEFKRVSESFEKRLISTAEFDKAKYTLEEAELIWNETKLNLSYTQLTAPINGVVAERLVRKGDRVQPAEKLFRIVDTSDKIALVHIPEKDISSTRAGQQTYLVSEFLKNSQFKGKIKRISPVVDPNSGTFKVTIGIDDPRNELRPGMFVSVRIITDVHQNVIAVPKDAIVYDAGLPFVFIVKDGKAHKLPLNQGFSDEEYVESTEGLNPGDEIIIVGQSGLKDKTAVKVMITNGGYN